MFQALWDRASQHARVMYEHPRPGITERGGFETRAGTGKRPVIVICDDPDRKVPHRPCWECGNGKVLSDVAKVRDLITLAHEYGHLVSYQNGTRTPEYEAAWGRVERGEPRLEGDANLIIAEETSAWANGRAALQDLGFTQWEEFDPRESVGIDLYRRSFA
jgi:hypothetical protein